MTPELRGVLSAEISALFAPVGLTGARRLRALSRGQRVSAFHSRCPLSPDIQLDLQRTERLGFDEAIFCAGKAVVAPRPDPGSGARTDMRMLLTRLSPEQFAQLPEAHRSRIDYEPISRTGYFGTPHELSGELRVAVVAAGTSDVFVSREAARTLRYYGVPHVEMTDVGVAGLWRLLERVEEMRRMSVVIAVAGMDAALPTVLGGFGEWYGDRSADVSRLRRGDRRQRCVACDARELRAGIAGHEHRQRLRRCLRRAAHSALARSEVIGQRLFAMSGGRSDEAARELRETGGLAVGFACAVSAR